MAVSSLYIDIKSIGNKILITKSTGFIISTNLGNKWIDKTETLPHPLRAEINRLVVDKERVYASSGSELWISYDSAETWSPLITGNNYTSVNSLAVVGNTVFAASSPSVCPSSFSDAVFSSNDNGASWVPKGIKNIDIYTLISSGNILIANGFLSTDKGLSWRDLSQRLIESREPQGFAMIGETIFANNRYKGIMRSDDYGNAWTPINNGLGDDFKEITAIYAENNKLYAVSQNTLYFTDNLGESWNIINSELPGNKDFHYSRISVEGDMIALGSLIVHEPVDSGAYCLLSVDHGKTWKNITPNLELNTNKSIECLAIKDGIIYLAINYLGVFTSSDSGRNLVPKNKGIASDSKFYGNSFAFLDDYIYIGTKWGTQGPNGDAIYRAKISDLLSIKDEEKEPASFTFAPNPAGDFITITNYNGADRRFKILNLLGQEVLSGEFNGDRIPVSALPPGAYMIRIGSETGMMLKK